MAERETPEQLAGRLNDAFFQLRMDQGREWAHIEQDLVVEVTGFRLREADLEVLVDYNHPMVVHGMTVPIAFSRPLSEFLGRFIKRD